MPRQMRSRANIKRPDLFDPSSSPPRAAPSRARGRAPLTNQRPAATSDAPRASRSSSTNRAPDAPGAVSRSRSRSVSKARSPSPAPSPPGPRGRGRTRAAPRAAANPPAPPTARPSTSRLRGAQNSAPNRPASRSTVPGPSTGNFSDAQLADIFDGTDLDLNDTSEFDTIGDFQKALSILMEPRDADGSRLIKPDSKTFVKVFVRGEHLFKNPKVTIHTCQNGRDFEQKKGAFKDVFLVKNKDGLGLEFPDDFSSLFKKIQDFVRGRNDETVALSLEIANEISRIHLLFKDIKLPNHVRDEKMDEAILAVWRAKVEEIDEQLERVGRNKNEKDRLNEEKTSFEKKIAEFSDYQNSVGISTKNLFVHVYPLAASVYYHVVQGKRIIYVAPGSEKNMRIYRKHKALKGGDRWIVDELFNEFQRFELCEGETTFIPAGYLHFEYTSEDSLAIGGYYLTTWLNKQFQVTEIEEEAPRVGTVSEKNVYTSFYNAMWTYTEEVLIPKLEESNNIDDKTRTAASILLKMDPTKKVDGDGYNAEQKEDILVRLEEALEQFD